MTRIVTLLGVLVLFFVAVLSFINLGTEHLLLMVDVGSLLVGVGLLTGR